QQAAQREETLAGARMIVGFDGAFAVLGLAEQVERARETARLAEQLAQHAMDLPRMHGVRFSEMEERGNVAAQRAKRELVPQQHGIEVLLVAALRLVAIELQRATGKLVADFLHELPE